ncbi:MAG: ABC transporter permease, partial [Planctomycetota bacterium]
MTPDATIATLPAAGAATPAADRWAGRLDATLERASDWLNPILVKETRQALKSRQFVLWFLLLLGACWIVTIGGVTLIGPSIYYASTGGMFYWAYFIVLAFPLMVVVPFSAYRSLAAEQEENTRDLLMVSALSPQQIVNGKIGSAVLQMMVYFSALAPCLAFTYLLRGVDLVSIVMPPVYVFAASLLLSMAGLTAASLTRRKYGQVILSIGFVVLLLSGFGWGLGAIALLMTEGFQYFRDSDFWIANLMALNSVVTTFLLLYYAAAGLNTFTAANRSTPIRVVLFIKQACCVGWVSYAYIRSGYESELLFVGIALTGLLWFAAGGVMTGEAPVLSNRVRRTLPTTAVGRVFGSWFNPGPGTGLMFAVATWSATVGPVLIALLLASPQTPNTGA